MKKRLLVLVSTCVFSVATCLTEIREVLLPPESTPETCFQLDIGDNLVEIPCSVFD